LHQQLNKENMATKTFKLGEVCKGGVITVEADKRTVTIIAKDWDFSTGSRKSSDQSKAKEWDRLEVFTNSNDAERQLNNYLHNLTTSYHAEQVMDWIKSKTTFTQNDW
jgi:hypothetical protein